MAGKAISIVETQIHAVVSRHDISAPKLLRRCNLVSLSFRSCLGHSCRESPMFHDLAGSLSVLPRTPAFIVALAGNEQALSTGFMIALRQEFHMPWKHLKVIGTGKSSKSKGFRLAWRNTVT